MNEQQSQNDEALIAAIAAGSMPAISEFYRRHEARVYRFVLAKMNDKFAAADLLNEVMLEVWKSAARFEGRAKVTTWLLSIANHKVLDYWRKQGAQKFTELDDSMEDESSAEQLEQIIAAASDSKLLRTCMAQLSSGHREVLQLVFFEELDYSEVSAIMQVPEGTVKSRVFHAKNHMKKQLAKVSRLS